MNLIFEFTLQKKIYFHVRINISSFVSNYFTTLSRHHSILSRTKEYFYFRQQSIEKKEGKKQDKRTKKNKIEKKNLKKLLCRESRSNTEEIRTSCIETSIVRQQCESLSLLCIYSFLLSFLSTLPLFVSICLVCCSFSYLAIFRFHPRYLSARQFLPVVPLLP